MTARTKRRRPDRGPRAPRRAADAGPDAAAGAARATPPPGPDAAAGAARATPPPGPGGPDRAALAAAVLGPLALYAATLPRTVALEDDGLFLMAGAHLGVAHPPGYPVHTLVVHLFMRLPFGDPAVLGHLSSAVLGALACGAVYCCARLLRASPVPALAAAWLFGVSEQFWSQAIITEVYTLNALLFFAAYALALTAARDPRRGWPLWCAAVAWGAGLANHWPLTALATPGLALVLLPVWRDVLPRLPGLLGAALAAAALPYAWMVWLSHQAPFISFYGPIEGWGDLWFYVSRQGYSGVDVSPTAGWSDRARFLGWFATDLVRQTTLPGAVLAGLGLAALARGGLGRAAAAGPGAPAGAASGPRPAAPAAVPGPRRFAGAAAAGSGVLALLGDSVVLIVLLDLDFDPFRIALFRPYPLICYGVAALWTAAGLQWAMDRLPGWAAWPASAARTAAAPAALAGIAMVAWSAGAGWPANDRSDGDFAQRHVEVVFDLLPPDAALFAYGEALAPLGYHRYVEERRPDIDLYSLQGLVFRNRLFNPPAPNEDRQPALDRFVASTGRRVFLLPEFDISPTDRGFGHLGFVLEVLEEGTGGVVRLGRAEGGERYFLELLDRRPVDVWEQSRRNLLLSGYGNYLGLVVLAGSPLLLEPLAPLIERAEDCYPCLLGMAGALLDHDAADHADRIAGWLARGRGAARRCPHQAGVGQGLLRAGPPGRADRRRRHRRRPLPPGLRRLPAPRRERRPRPPPPRPLAVTAPHLRSPRGWGDLSERPAAVAGRPNGHPAAARRRQPSDPRSRQVCTQQLLAAGVDQAR